MFEYTMHCWQLQLHSYEQNDNVVNDSYMNTNKYLVQEIFDADIFTERQSIKGLQSNGYLTGSHLSDKKTQWVCVPLLIGSSYHSFALLQL
jgi:hypothetical protein